MSDLIRRSDAVKAIASQLAFNAEMKTAEKFSWAEFVGAAGWILEKCETVDAVPVVRCNDCEHWDTDWETGDEPVTHFCAMVALRTRGDWFCADGERKAEP